MTSRNVLIALGVALLSAQAVAGADLKQSPVSPDQARAWIRHTVPLPKQIEIASMVTVPADKVAVRLPDQSPALVQQAAKELREALGQSDAPPGKPAFAISLELGGEEAAGLKSLKHSDQAYRIVPSEKSDGLRLVAIGQRGLYYASKTLQQVIKAKLRDGQARIPLLTVTDWPDMETRGLWGGDCSSHIRWLSDRKMNHLEHISRTGVDENKNCYVDFADFKQRIIDEGPTYGINPAPVILHLEQLKNHGLFDAYPELQGKDATPGVICYSNPKFSDVLAEWLVLWGKTPGVKEVDVWMAENMYGKKSCQCDRCKNEDRAVLETKSILKAWEMAKKQLPDLRIYMLTSEASEDSNTKLIPLLPPDLKLWYYHSLFTYNTGHAPIIRPYLVEAIKEGRWIGVCPNLSAFVGLWMPMTSPDFIHTRMNEFVDKGLEGLIGYAVPEIPYCRLNTEGAAEWTWNAKGRSPREFALSYAVRCGYKDPNQFADWTEAMGPVSWDVYGSAFPAGEQRGTPGKLADLLKEGKLPELGYILWDVYGIPFGDIKNVKQLNDDVAQAARGVKLARELGIPEYLHESLVVQGCIDAIKALYELKQVVKPTGIAEKPVAAKWFKAYITGLDQARKNLPLWEKSLPVPEPTDRQTAKAVDLLTEMIDGMSATAKELGAAVE